MPTLQSDLGRFYELLQKEDHEFLEAYSTSHWCEPSHFVKEQRSCLQFLCDNYAKWQKLFPDNAPLYFKVVLD